MDKFLVKFFSIQRMREWRVQHPEQWQQFSDWAGRGTSDSSQLNSDQRKWLDFIERAGAGGATDPFVREPEPNGFLKIKNFPTAADLTDDNAWEELYALCQNAWYQMKHDANKDGYPTDVKVFIDESDTFFDDISTDILQAKPETETAINHMVDLLDKCDAFTLENLGIKSGELEKFKNDIASKKYNSDRKFYEKLIKVADSIIRHPDEITKNKLEEAAKKVFGTPLPTKTKETYLLQYIDTKRLQFITSEYSGWEERATSGKLATFKAHFGDFIQPIYENKDIYDTFKSKEPSPNTITNAVDKARKNLDYDDKNSKNYIAPKRDDKLNLAEQIEKWAGDTYNDYFKKYEDLMGGKKVDYSDEVKAIIKAVDKAKIKPTDGLAKFIENGDSILSTVQKTNPRAAPAMEWFGKALKDFNADPKMAKTIKGALKNGRQMRNLISELVMRAAEDGKPETEEYVKIAMNVLRVIQYGNTTSKTLDILKEDKDLFNIFSNEKLSWNKNEGVQFITKAMDKTLRFAFFAVGRGAAFAYNKFRQRGKRFNGRRSSEKMDRAYSEWYHKNAADKAKAEADRQADLGVGTPSKYFTAKTNADTDKSNVISDFAGTMTRYGGGAYAGATDEDILTQVKEDISKYKTDEWGHQQTVENFEELINSLEQAKAIHEDLEELEAAKAGITGTSEEKIAKLSEIARQETELMKPLKKIGDKGVLDLSIAGITTPIDLKTTSSAYLNAIIPIVKGATDYTDAQTKLEYAQNAIYDRQSRIDKYRKAENSIKDADKIIADRKKRIDDWDKNHPDIYKRLMQYWDTLQDSSLTSYSPFAKRIENGHADINALMTSARYSAWEPAR